MTEMTVTKHDGRKEPFKKEKIENAVTKAAKSAEVGKEIADEISFDKDVTVDEIHDAVEKKLMEKYPDVAKAYILYRQKRTDYREYGSDLNKEIARLYSIINTDNANAANGSAASKMYSVAEAATKRYNLARMNPRYAENHKLGRIYIHDNGYFGITFNCFFNPLGKMLKDGFSNGVGSIRTPKRIGSATALACIILQSSQNSMFGGQGFLNFDTDLAPYVQREYEYQKKQIEGVYGDGYVNTERTVELALERTDKAVYQAMEQFVYNCNMMRSRSGAQVTFSSVNFGTDTSKWARMISKNLFKAYIAGLGKGENPIFPNLCYRVKDGINLHEGEPNFDITQLAIECVGKRIQPRFVFCDSKAYDGMPLEYIGTMGCRTAVRGNVNGDANPDARGNLAFNTINLPYLAIEAKEKNPSDPLPEFWDILYETMDDAVGELLERYDVIKNMKKRDIPFVADWYQDGAELDEDDTIEPMVKNGSLSMGFIGLAECLIVLTGKHHGESEKSQELGLEIIKLMRKRVDKAKKDTHLNVSLFASPCESACYTLMKKTKKTFGTIPNVTDKEYLTNSFHLPVSFKCDMKKKIDTEAPYHLYCNAGAIFYIEAGDTPKFNPEGVLKLIQYMDKSGIVYGGLNWVQCFCNDCGYQGSFDGACPKCGSENIKVTEIITGYLTEYERANDGKKAEMADRVSHAGGAIG